MPAPKKKKCRGCGQVKELNEENFQRKPNSKFSSKCRPCQEQNCCIWCGEGGIETGYYCSQKKTGRNCGYRHKRAMALTGELEPDDYMFCKYCGDKYPYFNFLDNHDTCTTISGKDCAKKISKQRSNERYRLKKKLDYVPPPPKKEKRCRGDCVDFLGRCLVEPIPYEGCYRATSCAENFATRNIMAYVR